MTNRIAKCLAVLWGVCASPLFAAVDPAVTIKVWPGKPPGETAAIAAERVRISVPPAKPQKEVYNVSEPTLEFFPPAPDKNNGAAFIILPGGGFNELKMDYEGEDCARWLSTVGVTGIVLKYRVPQREGAPSRYWPALQDAQRSISLVRQRAAEWKIDPNRIGIMGFSAGSVAGAVAEAHFDSRTYPSIDSTDSVSCRPDFAALIYPGSITENGALVSDIHVTKETPRTFIAVTNSDATVNSVLMYTALKQAGVSAELHIYSDGDHGFGMFHSDDPHGGWTNRLLEWMTFQKLLSSGPTTAPAVSNR